MQPFTQIEQSIDFLIKIYLMPNHFSNRFIYWQTNQNLALGFIKERRKIKVSQQVLLPGKANHGGTTLVAGAEKKIAWFL